MNRALLVVGAILIACTPAHAVKRANSATLSCDQAKALIEREGAVMVHYPSKNVAGLTLFDRFVANRSYCSVQMTTKSKTVPTATGPCKLLVCVQRESIFNFKNNRQQQLNFGTVN